MCRSWQSVLYHWVSSVLACRKVHSIFMGSAAESGYRQVCFLHSSAHLWLCLLLISELGLIRIPLQPGICITESHRQKIKKNGEKDASRGELYRVYVCFRAFVIFTKQKSPLLWLSWHSSIHLKRNCKCLRNNLKLFGWSSLSELPPSIALLRMAGESLIFVTCGCWQLYCYGGLMKAPGWFHTHLNEEK